MGSIGRDEFMAKHSAFSPFRLLRRELGFQTPVGAGDALARSLYCGMKPIASWDCGQANISPTGGVFNLEFSPEGSLLVAACEKKSIQIFDPLTHQRIYSVNNAHSDCVNCVKFLDGRMFATCSDDTTIALWDVRNLKKKIRTLLGHSMWVKNIEFSVKDKLLVTSGLDGSIFTWDINSYTESNLVYQRVFHASGLMRCRLSPDARQMVMCTTGGLLIIIHNLNLSKLGQDLFGFKPNLYRLMQMSNQVIPVAALYDHLFCRERKENRIEFITDFPSGNDAEVVSTLQIHPQGWSALSRNISNDDKSEWSCIHDIQLDDSTSDKCVRDTTSAVSSSTNVQRPCQWRPVRSRRSNRMQLHHYATGLPQRLYHFNPTTEQDTEQSNVEREQEEVEPEPGPSNALRSDNSRSARSSGLPPSRLAGAGIQNDIWEASITIKQNRALQEVSRNRTAMGRNFYMQRIIGINSGITPRVSGQGQEPTRVSSHPTDASIPSASTLPSSSGQTPSSSVTVTQCMCSDIHNAEPSIRQNKDRLLYYIEETNEGKGFIKELCYSADGRLVCSPFGRGMRLLALNENCSELNHCYNQSEGPTQMVEVGQSLGIHQDLVVSSKFSPRHHILVTGCLEGKIVWYEPFSGESLY